MSNKKVYAIVEKYGRSYVAHDEEWSMKLCFDSVKVVSKAEYRKARASGMPSWGEIETKRKMEDSIYNRSKKNRKAARPA